MTRYLAFDIETAQPFPEDHNWRSIRPMGIACAAACGQGDQRPRAWYNRSPDGEIQPSLTRQQAQSLVNQLTTLTDPEQTSEPYTLLTWNGLGFDLDILAEESGMTEQCQQMALNHVDMMFHILRHPGIPPGPRQGRPRAWAPPANRRA